MYLLFFQSSSSSLGSIPYPSPSTNGSYQLAWSDEFTGSSLDTTHWNIVLDGNGGGNYETQYYTADAVSLAGGSLVLTAKPIVNPQGTNIADLHNYLSWDVGAPNPNEPYLSQRYYTSGKVTTRTKFSFQYGVVEVRAKLPPGSNTWPAIWMLPQGQTGSTPLTTWPNLSELDIMELFGRDNTPGRVFGSLNYGDYFANSHYVNNDFTLSPGQSFSDDYHVFSVQWEPNEIRWFVDGVFFAVQSPSSLLSCGDYSAEGNCICRNAYGNATQTPPAKCPWSFGTLPSDNSNPFYLILNVAIGGNLGGLTTTPPFDQLASNGYDYNALNVRASNYIGRDPQPMLVDYVRVYQLV